MSARRIIRWLIVGIMGTVYLAAWTYGEMGTFVGFPLALPVWVFSLCMIPMTFDLMDYWRMLP